MTLPKPTKTWTFTGIRQEFKPVVEKEQVKDKILTMLATEFGRDFVLLIRQSGHATYDDHDPGDEHCEPIPTGKSHNDRPQGAA